MLTSQFPFGSGFAIGSTTKAFTCGTCNEPVEAHGMRSNSADPAAGHLW